MPWYPEEKEYYAKIETCKKQPGVHAGLFAVMVGKLTARARAEDCPPEYYKSYLGIFFWRRSTEKFSNWWNSRIEMGIKIRTFKSLGAGGRAKWDESALL